MPGKISNDYPNTQSRFQGKQSIALTLTQTAIFNHGDADHPRW